MRHDPASPWPELGYRFEAVGSCRGESTSFTCQAFDALHGRHVTLRVVTDSAPAAQRDLFEREAGALASIGPHAAVMRLYERARLGAAQVLILQAARPRDPSAVLAPPDAVRTIVTLAGGVETAHRLGILHGAIAADVVYYDEGGRPLLSGFHRRIDDPQPPPLHDASPYTPPEILLGENVTEAVDVYGLGSTLYELMSGHPAIRSYPDDSPAALSLRVLNGTVAGMERADVPYDLVDVLNWALSVEPAQRPPSVAWFAEELGRIERSQGWPHTPLRVGGHPAAPRDATR